nr:RNA-directed DNA polymerase, eukaryota, reverse transcriptase zinc-binding domain protein [Tanacetum cinerariifolium]
MNTTLSEEDVDHMIIEDVCKVIKEFFSNGKLLGELNATLIALVPKCSVPQKSAFVPGRHIQDNILITQEFLRGHNKTMDDLIVVCNGDKKSLEVVKDALNDFSMVFGLFPNLSKSIIYFGSINERDMGELLNVLSFQCETLRNCLKGSFRILVILLKVKLEFHGKQLWEVSLNANDSWGWKNMLDLREKVKSFITYNIGNRRIISMWHERWCEQGPLIEVIINRSIYDAIFKNNAKVTEMIVMGVWKEMDLLMKLDKDYKNMEDVVRWLADQVFKNNLWKVMNIIILAAVTYYLWQERNCRLF